MTNAARRWSDKQATPLELPMHFAVADLLRMAIKPGWIWFHCPSGEFRFKATAGKLKRMGVKPGVADILLISPVGAKLHALELKRKHRSPTSDQTDFLNAVQACGGHSAWADSLEDAVTILLNWGAIRKVEL